MAVSQPWGDGYLPAKQLQPRRFCLPGCFWHPWLTTVPVWPSCWVFWEGSPPRNSDACSRYLSGQQQSWICWGCHVHPMLEQHRWEAQRHRPPVPGAVEVGAHPCKVASASAQLLGPKPWLPTVPVTDLSVWSAAIRSVVCPFTSFSPLAFPPPLPLFSSYCPYLVRPYYLLLSTKASNLWQHLVFGWTWTEHISSIFCMFFFFNVRF